MWHDPCARRSPYAVARVHMTRRSAVPAISRRRLVPAAEILEGRQLLTGITEYRLPIPGASPVAITQGSGTTLWFANQGSDAIGSIDTVTHVVQSFPIPTAAAYPTSLTAGLDGKIWFTEERANRIGVLDPTTGQITEISTPTADSSPYGITVGPDGNLWFTELGAGKVAKIDPWTGIITEYATPTLNSEPDSIAVGADGNLWFTEFTADQIGRIDPKTGQITEIPLPTASAQPAGIAAGPDGNLWFTEYGADRIGRINPTTQAVVEYATPSATSRPWGITAGPDGNLWFTEHGSGLIGQISPSSGVITEFRPPTGNSAPVGITAADGGNIWFVEAGSSSLGVVTLAQDTTQGPSVGATAPTLTSLGSNTASFSNAGSVQLVGARVIRSGHGRRRHMIGVELTFAHSVNARIAQDASSYMVVAQTSGTAKQSEHAIAFRAVYSSVSRSVRILLDHPLGTSVAGRIAVNPSLASESSNLARLRRKSPGAGSPLASIHFILLPTGKPGWRLLS